MIGICRHASRNVEHWQNGDMCLRWTAAGMLEAERQFRCVIGYPKLPALAVTIKHDIARQTIIDMPAPEVAASPV